VKATFASLKFGRRGVLVAAVMAAGVGVVIFLQRVLQDTLNSLSVPGSPMSLFAAAWIELGSTLLLVALPFAVGVFLSLWQLAPIASELRLFHVITRALLAAVNGAGVVFVVTVIASVVLTVGDWFPAGTGFAGTSLLRSLTGALQAGLGTLASAAPLVVLAGILLWLWLAEHPSKHAVSGMLDEV
jgi:hypothetical protein